MKARYWKFGLGFGILFFGLVMLGGLAVMVLWNHLMPAVFGANEVNFGQALGLLVLARLLTGGFGRWGGGHCGWGGYGHGRHWRDLSPEDREKMKQRYFNSCYGKYSWHREEQPEEGKSAAE